MTYRDPYDDGAQPICPSCGVTMHPLLEQGGEIAGTGFPRLGGRGAGAGPQAGTPRALADRGPHRQGRARWAEES